MANEHIFKSNVIITGSIEASSGFVGDGTGLTGITSTTVWDGNLNGSANITGSLTISSSTAVVDFTDTLAISGSNFSGSFAGLGSGLTNLNIDNVTATGVNLTGTFSGNGSALTGLDPFPYYGDAKITGSLVVSSSVVDFTDSTAISGSIFSGSFVGDGTGLSGLTASPAGTNTQIQYNSNGVTGASSALLFSNGLLNVSSSIQVYELGNGALRLSQDSSNISLLQARGDVGTNMGTFLFQGRNTFGTTSDYLTLSSAVVDAQTALIKGGRLSVGGSPATTPTTAQGNLYVKRSTSSAGTAGDTVATFINSDTGAYGGGGFIDIIGNSNDYASGGIRVLNGTSVDGEIYYAAGSRKITLHVNKRGISLNSSGLEFKNNNTTQLAIDHDGNVGVGTTTPQAKLDVTSTTDGVLLPRLTHAQMYGISSPPAGLMVYNTSFNKLCVYNGTNWQSLDATTIPFLQP
jgi:hypothetical protein